MKNDELLDLVNEKDEVIGTVWKSVAHKNPKLIHREVDITVFTKTGEVLLQQRGKNKTNAGAWKNTASGHAKSGENPKDAIARELHEELGIYVKPMFYTKILDRNKNESRFFWIYYALIDEKIDVTIDQNEVMDAKWADVKDLKSFAGIYNYNLDGMAHKIILRIYNYLINQKLI